MTVEDLKFDIDCLSEIIDKHIKHFQHKHPNVRLIFKISDITVNDIDFKKPDIVIANNIDISVKL